MLQKPKIRPKPTEVREIRTPSPTAGLLKSKNATIEYLRNRMRVLECQMSSLQRSTKEYTFKRSVNRPIAIVKPYRYNPFRKLNK